MLAEQQPQGADTTAGAMAGEPIAQMKELIKEMQLGQTRQMEVMMQTMFMKMQESTKTAGLEARKGCEPGQIDDKKHMRGPDPFDGQEKRYMEWKAKMTVYLKMKVPESVNIFKYISKHQDKQINEKEMEDMTEELIIERKLLDNFSMALHELLLRKMMRL